MGARIKAFGEFKKSRKSLKAGHGGLRLGNVGTTANRNSRQGAGSREFRKFRELGNRVENM